MVGNSGSLLALLKPEDDASEHPRTIIEKHPLLRPHLDELQSVHDELLSLVARTSVDSERLARLRARQEAHDKKHDDAVRFCNALLATAILATTGEDRLAFEALAADVQPLGDALVNASYVEEAGAAAVLEQKLDKALRARLARVALEYDGQKRTLLDAIKEQIAAGRALGKLETEKRMLEGSDANEGESDEDRSYLQKVASARNEWIRTVQLFASTVERAKKLTARERATLLGVIEANQGGAARRDAIEKDDGEAKKGEPERDQAPKKGGDGEAKKG